ncbi:L-histidine N(alpha)-methyltransferase [Candidatus Woesearchaeota archaeon]|nr:L-histidine N(alpha)-methyltransferase [Candidatus Woesearchaeota archaeon]
MQINDLIFRELVKRGYALESQTRVWNVADSKLWYLTPKQAQGFLDLEKNPAYKKSIIDNEIKLIKKHLKDLLITTQGSINIIDLGCGDGKKASLFIKDLSKHIKVRYCPIDISAYMVSKAAKTIRQMKIGEVLEFKWNISDFENLNNITPLFRDQPYNTHFMMLLGNTLGNFEGKDLLHGIKKSMEKNDVLIIGNGLSDHGKNLSQPYKNKLLDKFLIHVIKQIGLKPSEVKYGARFKNSRVEMFYVVKKDKLLNHLGRRIHFKSGDLIVTAISYKYSKSGFIKMLSYFFSNIKTYTDAHNTYALSICKK